MKAIKESFKFIFFTAIMILATSVSAFSADVIVYQLVGEVQWKAEGAEEWSPAQFQGKIPVNSEVRVNGKEDSVVLKFPDGTQARIMGLSSIKLKNISNPKAKKTRLKLLGGKLFCKVKKQVDAGFEVETDSAVAAVRGTSFGMSFLGGEGNVVGYSGAVDVSDNQGNTYSITPGMYTSFSRGGALTKPARAPQKLFKQYGQKYTEPKGVETKSTEPSTTRDTSKPATVKAVTTTKPSSKPSSVSTGKSTTIGTPTADKKDDKKDAKVPGMKAKSGKVGGFEWTIASETIGEIGRAHV